LVQFILSGTYIQAVLLKVMVSPSGSCESVRGVPGIPGKVPYQRRQTFSGMTGALRLLTLGSGVTHLFRSASLFWIRIKCLVSWLSHYRCGRKEDTLSDI